jgi:Tol biopolymer transport system component
MPAWSPDGSKLAFVSNRAGLQGDIWVMNAGGGAPTNLTNNAAVEDSPAWSPDGSMIAFRRVVGAQSEIFVMDAGGGGQTNITTAQDDAVVWSPDGSKIAFRTNRDGNLEIYTMNADGSSPTNLTSNPAPDSSPAWSPDGSWIAFDRFQVGNEEVFVVGATGGPQANRSNSARNDTGPVWSPDSNRVAFSSTAFQGHYSSLELRVVDAAGGASTPLYPTVATDCCSPDWRALPPVGGVARPPDVPRARLDVGRTRAQSLVLLVALVAPVVIGVGTAFSRRKGGGA